MSEIVKPEYLHVVPVDDLREHVCELDCWCGPTPSEEEPLVIVHNAMDQRELYERGERKLS